MVPADVSDLSYAAEQGSPCGQGAQSPRCSYRWCGSRYVLDLLQIFEREITEAERLRCERVVALGDRCTEVRVHVHACGPPTSAAVRAHAWFTHHSPAGCADRVPQANSSVFVANAPSKSIDQPVGVRTRGDASAVARTAVAHAAVSPAGGAIAFDMRGRACAPSISRPS